MEKIFNYKGYRYFVGEATFNVFKPDGSVVQAGTLKVDSGHKKMQEIIDKIKEKEEANG